MASFKDIISRIDDAVATFLEKVPGAERKMLEAIDDELSRIELRDGKIKPTVANLKIVASIKNKLLRVILTDEYKAQVKEFVKAFNDITVLHNEYWRTIEKKFKPSSILREVKKAAISDTISKLTEAGIESSIGRPIGDILTQNITQGGSMRDLKDGLLRGIAQTDTPGFLTRYTTQIVTDSINQYSRNYTQIVTSDLGLEWFGYRNTLIKTSRAFCIAMVERRYFHVSEIPMLIKGKDGAGEDLLYKNPTSGKKEAVPINKKTNLPDGMYPSTNVANFLTLLGGYNCGHQAGPVSELLVKTQNPTLYNKIVNSAAYKAWKGVNSATNKAA